MAEIKINRQPLFLVNYKDKWEDTTRILTQERIDVQRKYWKGVTTVVEDLGTPEVDCSLSLVGINTGRCYVEHWYDLVSPKELSDRDFEILRAWGCFLYGQVTGEVRKKSKSEDGQWHYSIQSECDSGD